MAKVRRTSDGLMMFYCPACKSHHGTYVDRTDRPVWYWNGDVDAPTFKPSIRVQGRELSKAGEAQYRIWCEKGHPPMEGEFDSKPSMCHSFVTDGRIQYLDDCTHNFAGRTIDLPELEA